MTEQTFIFLHGSPGKADNWAPLIEQAPAGVRCEAWDLLDHGARDAPEATLEDTVADVVDRVRGLGGPVTLVGHSFGAWVGARALGPLSERVARFVSIAGLPGIPPEVAQSFLGFATALESGQLPLPAAAQSAASGWLTASNPDPRHLARIAELIESDTTDRLARVLRRDSGLCEPGRRVQPFTTKTIAIHCVEDRAVPIALGRELVALGASARMVELDGDEHFPHWTRPAAVAELVFAD